MVIAAKIQLHLEQFGYVVTGIVADGVAAVRAARADPPDLILMDVNLQGDLDGIETVQVLRRETQVPIVYLTANTDDGTFKRARATLPEAFLSKPYRKGELQRVVSLALLRNLASSTSSAPAAAPLQNAHLLSDRIFVRHKERMVKLYLKDILYIEAERAYCKITTADSEYLLSIALGRLEEQLTSPDLLRVHRSYMINLIHIDEIGDNYVAIAGKAVPIGKSHRETFAARVKLIR